MTDEYDWAVWMGVWAGLLIGSLALLASDERWRELLLRRLVW